jgi:protein-tyrosine-phosphatase
MAAELFRRRIGNDAGWTAVSAGTFAGYGMPASEHAIEALLEIGMDLSGHKSQPVTAELVKNSDMIVVMTESHRAGILDQFPEVEPKVFLIKSFGSSKVPADISDPYGGSLNVYRKTRDEIDRALSDLILFIRTGKA